MHNPFSKLRLYSRYLQEFQSLQDIFAYRRCGHSHTAGPPVPIRMKDVPFPLWCRPATTDAWVLWDTFGEKYQRPNNKLENVRTVIDLGSNVGYTLIDFAVRYPGARIIGVEPDQDNFALAKKNIEPVAERCSLEQAAIWTHDGTVSLEGTEAWELHVADQSSQESSSKVTSLTMNTLFQKHQVQEADYVKMDIEGAEAEVLKNEIDWLEKVKVIKMEIHPPAEMDECLAILSKAGFRSSRDLRHPHTIYGVRR